MRKLILALVLAALAGCSVGSHNDNSQAPGADDWKNITRSSAPDEYGVVCYFYVGGSLSCVKVKNDSLSN